MVYILQTEIYEIVDEQFNRTFFLEVDNKLVVCVCYSFVTKTG